MITTLLKRLFPRHDKGTAAFITAMLLATLLITCITLNDVYGRGHDDWQEVKYSLACIAIFAGGASATFVFGKQ